MIQPPATASEVTLVIPARNAARVLPQVLDALEKVCLRTPVADVIVVDDGSVDTTAELIRQSPARYVRGDGNGPGAARNLGWREASTPWIWFIDSDCVAEPEALQLLLPHTASMCVAGVGGSYGNMRPDSLLASLIHEEIIERHLAMSDEVDFLATFNVLYRREALVEIGGFNEELKLAQDAELAFRLRKAGYVLRFEKQSQVKHFHPTSFSRYLRTQARQGYYRVMLYLHHPRRLGGDSYSSFLDLIQPPLAMITLASLVLLLWAPTRWVPLVLMLTLLLLQLPLTTRLVQRTKQLRMLAFAPMSWLRAFARGLGMSLGVCAWMLRPTQFGRTTSRVSRQLP